MVVTRDDSEDYEVTLPEMDIDETFPDVALSVYDTKSNGASPATVSWCYDNTGYYAYLLLNCDGATRDRIFAALPALSIRVQHRGAARRPAANGLHYEWFARIDRMVEEQVVLHPNPKDTIAALESTIGQRPDPLTYVEALAAFRVERERRSAAERDKKYVERAQRESESAWRRSEKLLRQQLDDGLKHLDLFKRRVSSAQNEYSRNVRFLEGRIQELEEANGYLEERLKQAAENLRHPIRSDAEARRAQELLRKLGETRKELWEEEDKNSRGRLEIDRLNEALGGWCQKGSHGEPILRGCPGLPASSLIPRPIAML